MKRFLFVSLFILLWCMKTLAQTDSVYREPVLTGEMALQMAREAYNEACKEGFTITVTVVDKSGQVLSVIRHHQAGVHTLQASYKKAYTACSQKRETGEIMRGIKDGRIPEDIRSLDSNFTVMEGGVPIVIEGIVVGGIGVGGAHGNEDTKLAYKGLAAILEK